MNQLTAKLNIRQAFQDGWAGTKRYFWKLLLIMIIFYGVSVVANVLDSAVAKDRHGAIFVILAFLIACASWVAQMIMSMGIVNITLRILKGEAVQIPDLFSHYRRLFTFVGASVLYGLIVMIGFMLLIIPGIYWAIKYQFYAYRIVEAGDGVFDALKNSGHMTVGIKWQLVGFALLLIAANIIGALCLGIGLLVSIPVTMIARASAYRQLAGATSAAPLPAPTPPAPIVPAA